MRLIISLLLLALPVTGQARKKPIIGSENAVARHLEDGEEYRIPLLELLEHGRLLFSANWTPEEGGLRPLMKGNGRALSSTALPLLGARSFNRVSGPDANSCAGCHNQPFGIVGGGGDFTTGVFVLAQRFDFATFSAQDRIRTAGSLDENGQAATLQSMGNFRATTGMFGSGYLEMLAREMTAELQRIRDRLRPGSEATLVSKSVNFGILERRKDGIWITARVTGLGRMSLTSSDPLNPPSLVIRPWHQAGNVVSLREFTNNAYIQHHGIETTERFGRDIDQDGDGIRNEMTRADVTAVAVFQASMAVPGRVIPRDPDVEAAILRGEGLFSQAGCVACHIPKLPLTRENWTFTEPSPFNLAGNLKTGEAPTFSVDLTSTLLPLPRLAPDSPTANVIWVPAYTDLKLHDITSGAEDFNRESLDMNQTTWTERFQQGNARFLTKRLWGAANEPPYFHHGLFTTLRQAILGHEGEAHFQKKNFENLPSADQACLIEFLKTLQVLPPNTPSTIVDERHRPRTWPPNQSRQ